MSLLKDARLRAFHTVAVQKSFTQAARHLLLTQQAVSFQVKSLEEELGIRLFERHGRAVELTSAGRTLFTYADQIVSLYVEADNHMSELTGAVPDRLRIAATNSIAKYVLPRSLGVFRGRYPSLQIALEVGNSDYVLSCLEDGIVDAAISSDGPSLLSSYPSELFIRDEISFIVPPDHPWRDSDNVSLESLRSASFVLRGEGSGTRQLLERGLAVHGLDLGYLNTVLVLGSAEAVKGAVGAGAGIGMVSHLAAHQDIEDGKLGTFRVPDLKLVRDFFVARPAKRRVHRLIDEFIDLARQSSNVLAA